MLYVGNALATGDYDGFVRDMAPYAALGIEEVHAMPWVPDPLAFVDGLVEGVLPALREL